MGEADDRVMQVLRTVAGISILHCSDDAVIGDFLEHLGDGEYEKALKNISAELGVPVRGSDKIQDVVKGLYVEEAEEETQDFGEFLAEMKKLQETRQASGEPFKPFVFYNRPGDMLEVWIEPDEGYVEHLTPQISVRRSFAEKKIIGFQVMGVRSIVEPKV